MRTLALIPSTAVRISPKRIRHEDFYQGTDAGKKELAKGVCAMADIVGGSVVIGVDDGEQDHAHALAPDEPTQGRGEGGSARFPRSGSCPSCPT
ncbi:hypothetical protein F5983_24725 [Streptomyces arboris]|uniref:Schlafen AlbA-2 domain-containing protein n=1 Tax=Streptomyces arboris TaxID=2600619 RepID=A0A5N5EGQ0_9ACTN|nr:hypothetical protein F5983_24725 [Streptomyces arboris]